MKAIQNICYEIVDTVTICQRYFFIENESNVGDLLVLTLTTFNNEFYSEILKKDSSKVLY